MDLVRPALPYLPSYADALRRGWSHDNIRGLAAAKDELESIAQDPLAFVEGLTDPEGRGPPIALPDGSRAPRLPGFRLWIWDGEFCGSIGLRWQPGTTDLPPYCLGHIGLPLSASLWFRANNWKKKNKSCRQVGSGSQSMASRLPPLVFATIAVGMVSRRCCASSADSGVALQAG
jgi:hypothetical protein